MITGDTARERSWIRELDDGRLRLPAELRAIGPLRVGAVGWHWCELTEDPDRPALPGQLEVRSGRLRLAPRAVLMRFGATGGLPVLVSVRGKEGVREVLLTTVGDVILPLLELARPAVESLWTAPGWVSVWQCGAAREA